MPSQKAMRAPSWVTWAKALAPVALYDGQVFGAEPAALPQPEFSTETQTFAPMEALTTEPEPTPADGALQSAISVAAEEQEPL